MLVLTSGLAGLCWLNSVPAASMAPTRLISAVSMPGRRQAFKQIATFCGLLLTLPAEEMSTSTRIEDQLAKAHRLIYNRQSSRIFETSSSLWHDPQYRLHADSPACLLRDLPNKHIVCVGEEHNHPEHHAAEVELLKAIHTISKNKESPLTVGLEMFDHTKDHKQALTDFIFGNDTLQDLRRRTDWDRRWGWPFVQHAKFLNFAKRHRIPLFGCNAPQVMTKFVETRGLHGLLGRPGIPSVDLSNEAHRDRFVSGKQSYAATMATSEQELQFAYEAQALREEWMAASAVSHARDRGGIILLITGRNHVAGRAGVPDRLHKRLHGWPKPSTVVMQGARWNTKQGPLPLVENLPGPEEADWVWYMEHKKGCVFG